VTYIETVSGTEIMNIKLSIEREISRRKNKKYVVTTIDFLLCSLICVLYYQRRNTTKNTKFPRMPCCHTAPIQLDLESARRNLK